MLSTITDALRAKFKDFKVRDLGYSQMRQYMASVGRLRAGEERPQLPRAPFPIARHALKISYSPIADTRARCILWKR